MATKEWPASADAGRALRHVSDHAEEVPWHDRIASQGLGAAAIASVAKRVAGHAGKLTTAIAWLAISMLSAIITPQQGSAGGTPPQGAEAIAALSGQVCRGLRA